jgi:RimJ/RimL family protein N-acetyltransferase
MKHIALPIRTRRLQLRDFLIEDAAAVFSYASDTEVTRFMFYDPRDEADARAYLARVVESQRDKPRLRWELAVVEAGSDLVIGACDLTLENEREGDLGYILGRPWWGQGYAPEAASAMVQAGFEQLGLERIFAMCDVNHHASRRVLEKSGLRRNRIITAARQAKGRWWDMWLYELNRDDWFRSSSQDAG